MAGNVSGADPPPIPYHSKPSQTGHIANMDNIMTNACYYPNWRVYRGETPRTLNYACLSVVFYAFVGLTADGYVKLTDEWADMNMEVDGAKGCLGSFKALKSEHRHLKVILSIGGASESQHFASVAADAITRDNFARSAVSLVQNAGLDGIDIDWEHPSNEEDGRNFLALLAQIRLYCPDNEFMLTAAFAAGFWALQHIPLNEAQQYLDFINLMAYDFSGPWRPTAGHHSQLYVAQEGENAGATAVDYVVSTGFPSRKVLLGIPIYGRSFIGASGPGDRYHRIGGDDGTFEYKALPRPGSVETTDMRVGAACCSGGQDGWVTYDNPATVTMKGQYCKEKNLGGLFYWTGTADVNDYDRSLIQAGFRALNFNNG